MKLSMTTDTYRPVALPKLLDAVEKGVAELRHMFNEHGGAAIAWSTRNLLELYIWTVYCTLSEANAKRFYDDSMRDTLDMLNIDTKFSDTGDFNFRAERERLIKEAEQHPLISDAGGKYTRLQLAAEVIGYDTYGVENKILSKFAHPTAMIVVNPEMDGVFKEKFFDAGIEYANGAFARAQAYLDNIKE